MAASIQVIAPGWLRNQRSVNAAGRGGSSTGVLGGLAAALVWAAVVL
ncbi:MAG: hypothetical protein JO166_23225 [Deltaproteobacteria bacterium]|nr:hypothetical protein [Deltaproteobacteria bacterium]